LRPRLGAGRLAGQPKPRFGLRPDPEPQRVDETVGRWAETLYGAGRKRTVTSVAVTGSAFPARMVIGTSAPRRESGRDPSGGSASRLAQHLKQVVLQHAPHCARAVVETPKVGHVERFAILIWMLLTCWRFSSGSSTALAKRVTSMLFSGSRASQ